MQRTSDTDDVGVFWELDNDRYLINHCFENALPQDEMKICNCQEIETIIS